VKQSLEEINVQSVSNSMSLAKETTDSLVLTKSPSVFLETFNYNISALYEGLDIKTIEIQPSIFAFILLDIQTVQICRLSPAIQFIVKKAEQPISIDQLVKASASFHNLDSIPEKFKQICVGLIQKLCEKGILIEFSKNIFHE
ncbi:MAG: hypothetical protein PUP91_35135, partial [Rhizonema sp. PD37]|nr:hypothetical protein [Rhizonema sp. PD37]